MTLAARKRIAYEESGPNSGTPVLLMHGFPYDVRAYDEVASRLAAAGMRAIVPYLRGYGPTRFLSAEQRLAAQPPITVPAIALFGAGSGLSGAEGAGRQGAHFTGPYQERVIPVVGHNIPQEAPAVVADAVLELLAAR